MSVDAKCKVSSTPRDVCSTILQAHKGCINSEAFTGESYERNFDRTCEEPMSTHISKSMNQTYG